MPRRRDASRVALARDAGAMLIAADQAAIGTAQLHERPRRLAPPGRVARAVQRRVVMGTHRHLHRRRDGVAVICTSAWCAPSRRRELAWRALLLAAPFAAVAAGSVLGPRWFGIALAALAIAAYVACGTRTLGERLDRDLRAANAPRPGEARGRGLV